VCSKPGAGQNDPEDRQISVHVGGQYVRFKLEPISRKANQKQSGRHSERLSLTFTSDPSKSWQDTEERRLEKHLSEVIAEMLTSAEVSYRHGAISAREWLIEQKAEVQREMSRRQLEAEESARKQREEEEQERISRLMEQASDLHRSQTIRSYVENARARAGELGISHAHFDTWAVWALKEADRVDPIKNGTILRSIDEVTARTGDTFELTAQ
jgi:hypothetical protein